MENFTLVKTNCKLGIPQIIQDVRIFNFFFRTGIADASVSLGHDPVYWVKETRRFEAKYCLNL